MQDIRERLQEYLTEKARNIPFDKVTVVPTKALGQTILRELNYQATKFVFNNSVEMMLEEVLSEVDEFSYFTYYAGTQMVDFEAVKDDELKATVDKVVEEVVVQSAPFCFHEWKETLGLFKMYKDCKKCGKKWEDL